VVQGIRQPLAMMDHYSRAGVRHPLTAILVVALSLGASCAFGAGLESDHRAVKAMKASARGPFASVQWFCADGTVQPPRAYACREHGGGVQHGALNDQALALRAQGYKIANLLAGIDAAAFVHAPDAVDSLAQLLTERYLIAADDGWILRHARFYRGAIHDEDERAGARALLLELCADDTWLGVRYPMLWTAAAALPHGRDAGSVQAIRQASASLADQDPAFQSIRAKIHGSPDASDAARVREYAQDVVDAEKRQAYLALADELDQVYRAPPLEDALRSAARDRALADGFAGRFEDAIRQLTADDSADTRLAVSATLLAALRDGLSDLATPAVRLAALDLGRQIEAAHFRAAAELIDTMATRSRAQRLTLLARSIDAAYGTGLLRSRERRELASSLERLSAPTAQLATYCDELAYLARVPGWAAQGLRFHFGSSVDKLAAIEPRAELFLQDRLRGSPLHMYVRTIDGLVRDAQALAGAEQRVFGATVGSGLRMLNPGLARGVLVMRPDMSNLESFRKDGIYLLPETVSELPPVAGILTQGEGNPLSHVQLLARNLGIPNVAVDAILLDELRRFDGRRAVLAVSPGGRVELAADSAEFDPFFEADVREDVVIRPDLEKLDLTVRHFVNLEDLKASDSGRIVGPKAAKLGELRRAFPQQVARGVAIPFGMYRATVLDVPYGNTGGTAFDWIVSEYRRIEALPDPAQRAPEYERLRAAIYRLIADTDPGPRFREQLGVAMDRVFGTRDLGVFVRSDTNVEDLPGFTGAGLNLTLPNVIGFDNVVRAISDVWASPYTERAFAWRNAHMDQPEHVYPAVLLLETVPADKSGVMITADVATGDRDYLSVAVNEGVGGAVEGQAAEAVRIDRHTGDIRLLSAASAPTRHVPSPRGGIEELPASGADQILQPAEARTLIEFAAALPERFPAITDAEGHPAPADVEFGFVAGKLELLQIRPFLESRRALGSAYLAHMDQRVAERMHLAVDMNAVPAQ
jgi:Pyruvate phosphate dikinase, AMP/ATP-binding domain